MKKSILLLIVLCLVMSLTACGNKNNEINYNIDSEIEKIINLEAYNEDLLDKEKQDKLKENAVNYDLSLIDSSLIGYDGADNKLPIENMFNRDTYFYETVDFDWLGELWTVNIFENSYTTELTAIRLLLGFDVNDMDYAQRKIRELSDNFLKKYSNVVYTSNLYEYNLQSTYDTPLDIIVSTEEAFITYRIFMFENEKDAPFPCIQIFFIDKEALHDISNADLNIEIERIKKLVDKNLEEVLLRTIKLSPTMGYIIDEPKKEENKTPEEQLISGGIFYN